MERDQDQPAGLRLRAGVQIQGRPGTLLALRLWPVQVKAAAKPKPGPRTSRGGLPLRLRAGVPVPRCPGTVLALGLWPGQVQAFTVERDQGQPATRSNSDDGGTAVS